MLRLKRLWEELERVEVSWDKKFLDPWLFALASASLAFAGVLGSLYSEVIKTAFPINLFPSQPWYWPWQPTSFWLLGLTSILWLGFRGRAADRSRYKAEGRLNDKAKEIVDTLRTMPPHDFLAEFAACCKELQRSTRIGLTVYNPTSNPVRRELAIRTVLQYIANLAATFDASEEYVRYGVNVMLFKDSQAIDQVDEIEERLRFCDSAACINKLQGILDLQIKLSATTTVNDEESDKTKYKSDSSLNELALPIPTITEAGGKYLVLPGAPVAFVSRKTSYGFDTRTLIHERDEAGYDFNRQIQRELVDFFEETSEIKSFVSIPLFKDEDSELAGIAHGPFAILNIHSNRANIFSGEKKLVEQFESICEPFKGKLVELLKSDQEN